MLPLTLERVPHANKGPAQVAQASHPEKAAWTIRPGHLGGAEQGEYAGPQAPIRLPEACNRNSASLTLARRPDQGTMFKVRGSRSEGKVQ